MRFSKYKTDLSNFGKGQNKKVKFGPTDSPFFFFFFYYIRFYSLWKKTVLEINRDENESLRTDLIDLKTTQQIEERI